MQRLLFNVLCLSGLLFPLFMFELTPAPHLPLGAFGPHCHYNFCSFNTRVISLCPV